MLLIASLVIGFAIASLILVKQQAGSIATLCSIVLNGTLLLYLSFFFNFIVNIGSRRLMFGLTSMGGVFGIIIGSFIMFRIFKNAMLMKAYFAVLPLIYSISKIGCYFGSCCGGTEYHGPLATNYIRNGEYVYPTTIFPVQLLEALCFMLIFIVMLILFNRLSCRVHIALNGILCCVAKFSLDFLRDSHNGVVISANQILCLITFALSILMLIIGKRLKVE